MVTAPLSMNFMLPVPEASLPAVEICSDKSVPGQTSSIELTRKSGRKATRSQSRQAGSRLTAAATWLIKAMMRLAMK